MERTSVNNLASFFSVLRGSSFIERLSGVISCNEKIKNLTGQEKELVNLRFRRMYVGILARHRTNLASVSGASNELQEIKARKCVLQVFLASRNARRKKLCPAARVHTLAV